MTIHINGLRLLLLAFNIINKQTKVGVQEGMVETHVFEFLVASRMLSIEYTKKNKPWLSPFFIIKILLIEISISLEEEFGKEGYIA